MIIPDGTDLRSLADAAVRAAAPPPPALHIDLRLFGAPLLLPLSVPQQEELAQDGLILIDMFCLFPPHDDRGTATATATATAGGHTHRLAVCL